jgi:hypothetical protein
MITRSEGSSREEWSHLNLFLSLYISAFVLHLVEEWKDAPYVAGFLTLATAIHFSAPRLYKYLLFLVASSAFYLLLRFPDLANHSNLILYTNGALLILIAVYGRRRNLAQLTNSILFPTIRLFAVIVYVMAGLHKLNGDFFNPSVSCISNFLNRGSAALGTTILGLPAILVVPLALAALVLTLRRLPPARAATMPAGRSRRVLRALLLLLAAFVLVVVARASPFLLPVPLQNGLILVMAALILLWELLGGLMLLVPRAQPAMLAISWVMHGSLALIGFVDFGAVAVAVLITFLPAAYASTISGRRTDLFGLQELRGDQVVFLFILLIATLTGLEHVLGVPLGNVALLTGLLFNAAVLHLLWPLLRALRAPDRPRWQGVAVVGKDTPVATGILGGGLALFGMTSYLGLRTAGNFSMFSNLRTEGQASNHLLLRNNPLKIWKYQEDVVHILAGGEKESQWLRSLRGSSLPVVEFRKRIHQWTEQGEEVPMRFIYRGKLHETPDIVKDPVWRSRGLDAEMFLMDFRPIQLGGANRCRW